MMKLEAAKTALERIRLATNARQPADPQDVDTLVSYLSTLDTGLPVVVDLLRNSQNAFRSKTIEKARKLLEEIAGSSAETASIVVSDWALCGRISRSEIRGIAEPILAPLGGAWVVEIRGSAANDLWEGIVRGPGGFEFRQADIGPRHDVTSVRDFVSRASARFADKGRSQ